MATMQSEDTHKSLELPSTASGDSRDAPSQPSEHSQHDKLPQSYDVANNSKQNAPTWKHIKRLTAPGINFFAQQLGLEKKKTHVCIYPIGPGQYCNKALTLGQNQTRGTNPRTGDVTFATTVGIDHMKKEHPESEVAKESKKAEAKEKRSLEDGVVMLQVERALKSAKQEGKLAASAEPAKKTGANKAGGPGTMTAFFEGSKVKEQEFAMAQASW